MCNELETPRQRAGHVGGRAFLLTVAGLAAVAGALGLMYLAWVTENHFTRSFQFEAPVVTPLGLVPDIHGTIGESDIRFSSVSVESDDPLPGARLAIAASEALYFLLFISGCAAVMLICRRLWKNKAFTVLAHWSLLGLGLLAAGTAMLSPWLAALSANLAATTLGVPGESPLVPGDASWVVTHGGFSFQDANHSLLALGVLLVLLSLAFRSGTRLQADAEGLV
ncbi:MAG: hypothetical protein Q4P23_06500 [Micrococcaceae bacterium]|nr:hypothetical protein [Micrococcaceae bacterium]